jgi:hypothetical protein
MSFKPGKVVAALTKVVPDVGAAIVIALKTELLSKDDLTLAEAAACLTKAGIPSAKVLAMRVELKKDPQTAAPAASVVCAPEDVVAALTKSVPDLDEAIVETVSTELLAKDELTLAEAVTLLLGCGVSPAQVFDVREELASPPPAADAAAPTPVCAALSPMPQCEVIVCVCACMCVHVHACVGFLFLSFSWSHYRCGWIASHVHRYVCRLLLPSRVPAVNYVKSNTPA